MFTEAEANELIPVLTPLLLKIQKHLSALDKQRLRSAETMKRAGSNGHHEDSGDEDALAAIGELTEQIERMGCVLADHSKGTVEFPCVVDDRFGYLEWVVGESAIKGWRAADPCD